MASTAAPPESPGTPELSQPDTALLNEHAHTVLPRRRGVLPGSRARSEQSHSLAAGWMQARRQVYVLLAAVYTFVVLRTAWLGDDAFITFRVVDNFVNGYGLRWNVAERVQVYTNPLWMFLLSGFYWFTREIYYTSIFVSVGVSVIAVSIFLFGVARTLEQGMLGVLILILSKAFVDFSACGLENPLTYLLIVAFWLPYTRPDMTPRRFLALALIGGLAGVNRMDTLLLFAPPLLAAFWEVRSWRAFALGFLAFLPFWAWEVFSVIYYGFPFPNTAYAKIATGVPTLDVVRQGLFYLLNSICADPLTLVVVCSAVVWAFLAREWRACFGVAGMMLYIAYVIWIGGDFMSGRFLAAPLMAAVCILATLRTPPASVAWLGFAPVVLLLGFAAPYPTLLTDLNYGNSRKDRGDPRGVSDERAFYYQDTGLLQAARNKQMPTYVWAQEGRRLRDHGAPTLVFGAVGMRGYFAGPRHHIIDRFALGDPLLARLPLGGPDAPWRIGHFNRTPPPGYVESATEGRNRFPDKRLGDYYDRLCTIIRGPIFRWHRFPVIWKMNTGAYNYLIERYLTEPPEVPLAQLSAPVRDATVWNVPGATVLSPAGIMVDLGEVRRFSFLDVSLDHNDGYRITYLRNGRVVGEQESPAQIHKQVGIWLRRLAVPAAVAADGADRIWVKPVRGDGMYSVGHLRLIEATPAAASPASRPSRANTLAG
jgi:arabinofuranosyltransferase